MLQWGWVFVFNLYFCICVFVLLVFVFAQSGWPLALFCGKVAVGAWFCICICVFCCCNFCNVICVSCFCICTGWLWWWPLALAVCGAVALWWLSPSSQVSPVELGRRSRGNGARWTCRESFALAFSSPKRERERERRLRWPWGLSSCSWLPPLWSKVSVHLIVWKSWGEGVWAGPLNHRGWFFFNGHLPPLVMPVSNSFQTSDKCNLEWS